MYKNFERKNKSFSNLWTALIRVSCFMDFLRFNNVAKLRRDIITNSTFLSIFIKKSKTDIYCEESWIYFTRLESVLCPTEVVSQYFKKTSPRDNCQKYIFRGIAAIKFHWTLRNCDRHISCTCFRENVSEELTLVVNDRLLKNMEGGNSES